jgi:GTP 3',8-cyclase
MYCMPQDTEDEASPVKSQKILSHDELLNYEELLRIVNATVRLGMNKLRLTGGEPLVRRGVMGFIDELSRIEGLNEIRLTTNGVLLQEKAKMLYEKGIRHLNISLDTLKADKFQIITGRDHFKKVFDGIHSAMDLGFKIKLNIVAMRGVNDDEFLDFGKFALENPLQVRFIEFMPVGEKNSWKKKQFISAKDIQKMLEPLGEFTSIQRKGVQGPARMFSLKTADGAEGRVGFISPISNHFCDQCNRLRLTSEGRLRSCLLHDMETDVKKLIRGNCSEHELEEAIKQAIMNKPQGHIINETSEGKKSDSCQGSMSRIGG